MNRLVEMGTPSRASADSLPIAIGYIATVHHLDVPGGLPHECWVVGTSDSPVPANLACGMLVRPEPGDRVLCLETPEGLVVSQVIHRCRPESPLVLGAPGTVEWVAPVLRIKAARELELTTAGRLSLFGDSLILGAARTLIQQASHMFQNAQEFALTVTGLLRTSGRHQVMTAEDDVRIDGKTINMG